MQIDLLSGWKYREGIDGEEYGIPDDAVDIDLPADLLRRKNRNYNTAMGKYGSYYDSVAAVFYRYLPTLGKCKRITLELEGVCQFADVFVCGNLAAHVEGVGKHFIDITEYYNFGARNLLTINVWAPQMAGRYVGAGINGVKIHTHETGAVIKEDGIFVTSELDGLKAHSLVRADVCDTTGEYAKKPLTLEAVMFNLRGKKTARKIKKIKLKNTEPCTYEILFKLSRFYVWTVEDPYLYTVKIYLRDENGKLLDEGESVFGIVSRSISPSRGLVLCGRGVKLKGAVVMPDNGILGSESTESAEEYKLSRIKEIGYNAVRYTSVPTEAALNTLDKLGLMAQVDLFGVWAQGSFPYDGHVGFAERAEYDCARLVRQLRKHPSVVMYGLNADAPETYERGAGSDTADILCRLVRSIDESRPIVVNARERAPFKEELERAGIKPAKSGDATSGIGLAREKDLFGKLTAKSFEYADIAGYEYLYPRYSSDRTEFPSRLIVGSADYPSRAFEALDECEKNPNVVGEFLYCAADYLGNPLGKPEYEDEQLKLLPPHASYCGDLDLIYNRKPKAYRHAIMLGDRSQSIITVSNPDSVQKHDSAGYSVKETHNVWNWPHNLGKPIDIEVYSGGEVVALYRDGKLIGRKLAGRVNKHIATFRTDFYPGKLEAVSYHKGRECSRVTLESVTAPRAVKLTCSRKSAHAGELMFVEISVTDRDGRVVPYASREVEISVSGSGVLYALGTADPESQYKTAENNMCPVFDGKALAVIKAIDDGDGKITVKAIGDGLLSGKINLRVKD